MALKNNSNFLSISLTKTFWYFASAWTLMIISLLLFGAFEIKHIQQEMVKKEAQANFNKDQAIRLWGTMHGGIYVPITEETPSNPYLSNIQDRDIKTPSGKRLTLMNPAYMIRQLNEEYEDFFGIRGHITSLKYFRPETAPDEWERIALKEFQGGVKEVSKFTEVNGHPYYRYMAPMITKTSCLKCHGHQGYKVGDIRGGVSISVPMMPYLNNQKRQMITWGVSLLILWIIGILGLSTATKSLKLRIKERDHAETELQKTYDELENKVEERTEELYEKNKILLKEVTDRENAEKNLHESEERYKSLFKNSHSIMLLIDPDNADIVDVNLSALSYYGFSQEEFSKKRITDINTLSEEEVFQEMEKAQKEKRKQFFFRHRLADGNIRDVEVYSGTIPVYGRNLLYSIVHDITERKEAEEDRKNLIQELQNTLNEVKILSGLLPICAQCKKIRDDKGYWNQIEGYIQKYSDAKFSHGICPDCSDKLYGKEAWYKDNNENPGK